MLIYSLASKFSKDNYEDIIQVGTIGLINAYNNFNKEYNVKFSTYAYSFIIGEMKKYLRENKGIKISREISYLSSRLDKLIDLLTQKYKRFPTTKELSYETSIDEWKIIEALGIRNCVKSIDEEISDDLSLIDVIPSKDSNDLDINELMYKLDDNERDFINNRYFMGKSQKDMSKLTGYSQAKVSRKEKKILSKLKDYYNV